MSTHVSAIALAAAAAGAGVQTVVDKTAVTIAAPTWYGLPVDVLLWACAGAIASLAFTKPDSWGRFASVSSWRGKALAGFGIAFTLIVNAFITTLFVISLPRAPLIGSMFTEIPPMALAGLGAAFFQPLLRGGGAALGRWVKSKTPETPSAGGA